MGTSVDPNDSYLCFLLNIDGREVDILFSLLRTQFPLVEWPAEEVCLLAMGNMILGIDRCVDGHVNENERGERERQGL